MGLVPSFDSHSKLELQLRLETFFPRCTGELAPTLEPNNTGLNRCCAGIRVYYRCLPIINPGIYAYPVGVKKKKTCFGIELWLSIFLKIKKKEAFLTVDSLPVLS